MTDEHEGAANSEQGDDKKDQGTGSRPRGGRMGDGIRQGIGVLSAFKDALEETIHEARERGDLSADRAKEVMKEALEKAQSAAEGAKERLDFASQDEVDELEEALASLRQRVSVLEQKVFGAESGPDEGSPPAD